MARLSVDAVHVSFTDVAVGVVAARLVGVVGAVRSTVQANVAGLGSGVPFQVAKTLNVCEPAASEL
jgi:ethanolamine utilization microcompartment shell protein EutS